MSYFQGPNLSKADLPFALRGESRRGLHGGGPRSACPSPTPGSSLSLGRRDRHAHSVGH